MITIKESTLQKYMVKGFIPSGDMMIIPEDATKEDIEYLESCGYTIM